MRKKIALLALLLFTVFGMATVANAAIYSSDYIAVAQSDITAKRDGSLDINFSINGRNVMEQLGVKTIILQERANSNQSWSEVETFTYGDYPNMMGYKTNYHESKVTYYNAISGYEYRAKVYFYAENGGYDSREYITVAVRAK